MDSLSLQAARAGLPVFSPLDRPCAGVESLVGFYHDDKLCRLELHKSYDQTWLLSFDSGRARLATAYHWIRTEPKVWCGSIHSSLWSSMIKLELKPDMIMKFADLFSWDVDFFTETQNGDSFKLILEQLYCDEHPVGKPRLIVGEYKGKCGAYHGIFYEDPSGRKDYYTPSGECVCKGFLRSPLQYSRISSYFSTGRYHPILRIVRPHQGIDYSARTGTPVSAIGDGTVTQCGWSGGYGRLVEVSHGNGYRSRYGHLSRFGRIRTGGRVVQGQVVGYVGSTGLSTGPHLHFELRLNGVARNPLRIIPPRADPVAPQFRTVFKARADSLIALLRSTPAPAESAAVAQADSIPAGSSQDSTW